MCTCVCTHVLCVGVCHEVHVEDNFEGWFFPLVHLSVGLWNQTQVFRLALEAVCLFTHLLWPVFKRFTMLLQQFK